MLVIACCLASCAEEKSATAGLPNDWPLPQLVLGADWELTRRVVALHKQEDSPYVERTWLVVFQSRGSLSDAARHVEQCLRRSAYWKMRHGEGPSGFTSADLRTYFSPDYYVEVKLGRHGAIAPAGELGDGEYALLVIDHDTRPEILQVVVDLRKTNPEMADKVRDTMLEPL
jgi:hypothetical protein